MPVRAKAAIATAVVSMLLSSSNSAETSRQPESGIQLTAPVRQLLREVGALFGAEPLVLVVQMIESDRPGLVGRADIQGGQPRVQITEQNPKKLTTLAHELLHLRLRPLEQRS